MLRIPNRQNLLPLLYHTAFSVQKMPTYIVVKSVICSSSLSPDYQRPGSVRRNCDCLSDPVHFAGLHRNGKIEVELPQK